MISKIFDLIEQEKERQLKGLEMIPSENYVSSDVLKALGSILTDKYSEGFPGARYYGGNKIIDEIEIEAGNLANQIFKTKHAIVQPYSGSPANLAVDLGLAQIGDTILGMSLTSGGHLTHGASASSTSKLFKAINYEVGDDGKIELETVRNLATEHKPKIIWVGFTAYPYKIDFEGFSKIADQVGAYLVADISHIAGLVATGLHPSPASFAHVITSTTHKTLRGPRGAMILITEKGIEKDPEIIQKLERAVFPGLQGGPHNQTTAAMAVAFNEVLDPLFKEYIDQVVKNAKVLADELGSQTDNHLILLDLSKYGFGLGYQAQICLEEAGITINKNTVPGEKVSAFYPSGIRLGTAALTSRGMKESEMKKIATWILKVLGTVKGNDIPNSQPERKDFIKSFKKQMMKNQTLKDIKEEVEEFASKYPIPGID